MGSSIFCAYTVPLRHGLGHVAEPLALGAIPVRVLNLPVHGENQSLADLCLGHPHNVVEQAGQWSEVTSAFHVRASPPVARAGNEENGWGLGLQASLLPT